MAINNYDLYNEYGEDAVYAFFANRPQFRTLTCKQTAAVIKWFFPQIQRSLSAVMQHVAFIRRLLDPLRCPARRPRKYTSQAITWLQTI
ncbi:hypothetical protein M5X11_15915 [Paenibacillus alginolyticus]|uniref:hypothetical protein n=1 Tax=Paenibacillus alginolyticus TaxID=59839 RepID=UPI000492E64A|nr:hypothetical protein [Paenibacillus alginolyticus]MCY9666430.1 hypothetical protein [Paenibacillus alginolyticus]